MKLTTVLIYDPGVYYINMHVYGVDCKDDIRILARSWHDHAKILARSEVYIYS